MIHQDAQIAKHQLLQTQDGILYRFFCELSGAVVFTSEPTRTDDPQGTLRLIWKQRGKGLFNRCKKCGKWVCDLMYNADVFQCVDCAPWENKPNYCVTCGVKIPCRDIYCRSCGERLRYKEVWA